MANSRQVRLDEAQSKAEKWSKVYIETSAKTRENVDKAFFDLMIEIKKRKMADITKQQSSGKNKKDGNKKKRCCIL